MYATLSVLVAGCASGHVTRMPQCATQLRFAGIDWSVSTTAERFPGAARGFAWNECNVMLDTLADGRNVLVLRLHKDRSGWHGAQIESESTYQYGTFSVGIESSLRPMLVDSPSAVLGFFAYVGPAYSNEIDMEFTRWGNPIIPPMHYTVWHDVRAGATPPPAASFAGGADSQFVRPARHRFVWTAGSVTFNSFRGADTVRIGRPFTVNRNVPTKPMHIMLNLWVERQANMGAATNYEVKLTSVGHSLP